MIHDRQDIESLASAGLIDSTTVRKRAEEALTIYVGNTERVRVSLEMACRSIDAAVPGGAKVRTSAKPGRKRS